MHQAVRDEYDNHGAGETPSGPSPATLSRSRSGMCWSCCCNANIWAQWRDSLFQHSWDTCATSETQGHKVTRFASLEPLETWDCNLICLAISFQHLIRFSPSLVISHLCYKMRFLVLTVLTAKSVTVQDSVQFLVLTSSRPCHCHQMLLPSQAQVQVGRAGYALPPIPVENRWVWFQRDCIMFLR